MAKIEVNLDRVDALGDSWIEVGQMLKAAAKHGKDAGIQTCELSWQMLTGQVFNRLDRAARGVVVDIQARVRVVKTSGRVASERGDDAPKNRNKSR